MLADPYYTGLEKRIARDRRKRIRQRNLQRFLAKDLTFGKLQSESDEEIGQLLDISRSGLALRCFANGKETQAYSELDIFLSGGNFTIGGIPIKTVSDTELANRSPFSTVIFKRYGVQFENLTREQKAGLDYFLINHTSGKA
ncbi:MAG: PilZ domain-containing protein [Desulfobacteraceae bacterium]|nr:PilZ domain-containing protein [Desulfobacteraceae bacterium]